MMMAKVSFVLQNEKRGRNPLRPGPDPKGTRRSSSYPCLWWLCVGGVV